MPRSRAVTDFSRHTPTRTWRLPTKFLRERGIGSEMKVEQGDPVEEIRREALEGGYDLIVAGSREPGPVGRVVLGSVSAKLVKDAPCPVLVVGEGATVRHEPAVAVD